MCKGPVLQQQVEKSVSGGDEVQGTEAQCEKIHQPEQTEVWDCCRSGKLKERVVGVQVDTIWTPFSRLHGALSTTRPSLGSTSVYLQCCTRAMCSVAGQIHLNLHIDTPGV